jgi:hypothetical protein
MVGWHAPVAIGGTAAKLDRARSAQAIFTVISRNWTLRKLPAYPCLCLLAFLTLGVPAYAGEIEQSATRIDAVVQKSLGISTSALAVLLTTPTRGFLPKGMLEANGAWPLLNALEEAGLATVHVSSGLPDGTLREQAFVQIVLTPKGAALVAALQASSTE